MIMGHIYAEIELTNSHDVEFVRRHLIGEEEIRRMFTTMMVDTGAAMVCINENIQEILQLPVIDPLRQELIVNPDHPDMACLKLKGMRRRMTNVGFPRRSLNSVRPGNKRS